MGAALVLVGRFFIPNCKLYTQNSLAGKYNFHFLQGAVWVLRWPRWDALSSPTVSCTRNIKNVKRCRDGMPKSMQTR